MEKESNGRRRVMENLSIPRDLLQRFMSSGTSSRSTNAIQEVRNAAFRGGGDEEEEEEDPEELELSLGLSLGGRFGIDKSKKNNLVRSSSIIGTVPFVRDISFGGGGGGGGGGGDDSASPASAVSYPMLMRTASLPVETEEEWRKRKEIQTLRRMAAKRRRSEKQRNFSGGSSKAAEKEEEVAAAATAAASPSISRQNTIGGGGVDLAAAVAIAAAARSRQPNSHASVESTAGSSSGISELESRVVQGSSSYGETRSPAGNQMSRERSQESAGPGPSTVETKCSTSGSRVENPNPNPGGNEGREIGMNAMEDMPCVFTKGEGPNGRRVDGILYRYGKGKEVRIMCVCHGKFLSPAEFVKHAGGGDVDNPLRHIVINTSSGSFL